MDKKLTPAEIVIVASGLAVFVFSFFDYFENDAFDIGANAWDNFPLYTYAALFGLIAAAQLLATKLGNVQLPARVLGFTWPQIHLVLAVFAVLNTLGLFLFSPFDLDLDTGIGLIIGLLGSIGMVVGAVMLQNESTGPRPTGPSQF